MTLVSDLCPSKAPTTTQSSPGLLCILFIGIESSIFILKFFLSSFFPSLLSFFAELNKICLRISATDHSHCIDRKHKALIAWGSLLFQITAHGSPWPEIGYPCLYAPAPSLPWSHLRTVTFILWLLSLMLVGIMPSFETDRGEHDGTRSSDRGVRDKYRKREGEGRRVLLSCLRAEVRTSTEIKKKEDA